MKKILALLVAFITVFSCAFPVFAADGKVTYSGDAKNFIFEPGGVLSLTDLFPNFKGVMPGDDLTQQITVKNEASVRSVLRADLKSFFPSSVLK